MRSSSRTLPRVSPSEPRDADDEAGPGYDWAIVSGGQPSVQTVSEEGKCKNGDDVNNSGLWLFTREKVADSDTVDDMRAVLEDKGFDVSVLEPVKQEGCEYPDEL